MLRRCPSRIHLTNLLFMKTNTKDQETILVKKEDLPRRSFMKFAGMSVASAGLIMAGCKKKVDDPSPEPAPGAMTPTGINLGSGDIGILNYAYALEQLEAAFYTTVVADASFKSIFSAEEQMMLMDIKAHEIIHREFFKTALGASAIPSLDVDFSSIQFNSRDSILGTAKVFEDLGVAAYNGAGKLIVNKDYLLLAGKIVSVEARHASYIRDILNPKSMDFAGSDVVMKDGLDGALMPAQVLAAASTYVTTKINASYLPTA